MSPEQFFSALIDDDDRAGARQLASRSGRDEHDALVVLGSGLAPLADAWTAESVGAASGRLSKLRGVQGPTADGHLDEWRSVVIGGKRVVLSLGRTHLYERRGRRSVTALVRVAAAAGIGRVVLTNANGCLREWRLGDVVALTDHVNLTGRTPFDGTLFFDPRTTWDAGLAEAAGAVVGRTGVYAQLFGPEYQTNAETRLLAASGVDVVGMSTVHEAMMGAALGMRVAGLSVVSDLSLATEPIDADTVLAATAGAHATLRTAIEATLTAP